MKEKINKVELRELEDGESIFVSDYSQKREQIKKNHKRLVQIGIKIIGLQNEINDIYYQNARLEDSVGMLK